MDSEQILNAVIESTMLGVEPDHDVFTYSIELGFANFSQCFGLCSYDWVSDKRNEALRRNVPFLTSELRKLFQVVGVNKWENLKGKYIRAVVTRDKILKLGHIIKDVWLDPSEYWKSFEEEGKVEKEKIKRNTDLYYEERE